MAETKQLTYSVKGTYKDGSLAPYLIYDGWVTTEKDIAVLNCDSCNKQWGDRILFELIINEPE